MEGRTVDMTRSCPSPAPAESEQLGEDSARGPPITINELVQVKEIARDGQRSRSEQRHIFLGQNGVKPEGATHTFSRYCFNSMTK